MPSPATLSLLFCGQANPSRLPSRLPFFHRRVRSKFTTNYLISDFCGMDFDCPVGCQKTGGIFKLVAVSLRNPLKAGPTVFGSARACVPSLGAVGQSVVARRVSFQDGINCLPIVGKERKCEWRIRVVPGTCPQAPRGRLSTQHISLCAPQTTHTRCPATPEPAHER